jgi:hypothetical protein
MSHYVGHDFYYALAVAVLVGALTTCCVFGMLTGWK